MTTNVALRLRALLDANNWTVADMAERTGIPKRTLDKYMLKEGASLPGFDALCALSIGLGVSLDWLVFGSEFASEGVKLIVERAAHDTVKQLVESILRYHERGDVNLFDHGILLNMETDEWASYFGAEAAEIAAKLISNGVTKGDLLAWRHGREERVRELIMDRAHAIATGEKTYQNLS